MFGIRPYRLKDAEKIVPWAGDERAFYKWSAGIMGEYPLTVEHLGIVTSGRNDNPRYFPFVAFDDNDVVGFFTMRHPNETGDDVRFGYVIVDPAIRGKGYGKKMMQLAIKYAFEIYGASKVGLGVFENNPSAYHCYVAAGFLETGEVENYQLMGEEWNCIDLAIDRNQYEAMQKENKNE